MDREQPESLGFRFHEGASNVAKEGIDPIYVTIVVVTHTEASLPYAAGSKSPENAWKDAIGWAAVQARQLGLE